MTTTKHPAGHELQAYHDGELPADAAAHIDTHCDHCKTCRAELAELERMDGMLAGIDGPEMPRSVWPRVAAARRSKSSGPLGSAFGFAAATACAAGIAIGILLGPVDFSAESVSEEVSWTGPTSLWSGDASSSLLQVYQSNSD